MQVFVRLTRFLYHRARAMKRRATSALIRGVGHGPLVYLCGCQGRRTFFGQTIADTVRLRFHLLCITYCVLIVMMRRLHLAPPPPHLPSPRLAIGAIALAGQYRTSTYRAGTQGAPFAVVRDAMGRRIANATAPQAHYLLRGRKSMVADLHCWACAHD